MHKRYLTYVVLACCFVLSSAFAVLTLHPVNSAGAVVFTIKNLGIKTRGELNGLKGNIVWNEENPAAGSFKVSVDVGTINTGIDARDSHLKKDEYFDADKYPVIQFVSTAIQASSDGYMMQGNLTIKATTRAISFPFTATKTGDGYLFTGNFTIDRMQYGVGKGSMVLSDDVDVALRVQAGP